MTAKKSAAPKLVKVIAKPEFDLDDTQEGTVRLWGIDFTAKDGVLTGECHPDVAKAMKDAKKVIHVNH